LRDASAPFCEIGVQPFDIAALLGCDPLRESSQCGVGEECFVHPDTSSAVTSGVCLPVEKADQLAGPCRDFLISRRLYSVKKASAGELELVERRRVLRTTPLDGCESVEQCDALEQEEYRLASNADPVEYEPDPDDPLHSWACERDPSRAGDVDRCVMTCESIADCEDGFTCSAGGRCIEAPLPPRECLAAVQRYQMRVGEAFAMVGEDSGFVHDIEADPATGACVHAPLSSPFAVGRIPLRPEPCDDDDDPTTGPNPCLTTVTTSEEFVPQQVQAGRCVADVETVRERDTTAVRVSTPSMSFHLVDTETTGDLECNGDRAGELPVHSAVYSGYQILLDIGGGFLPFTVPNLDAALPVRVVPGADGHIWVLDQGDASSITNGRLFRLDPQAPTSFDLVVVL
jgi:hypothetical protein